MARTEVGETDILRIRRRPDSGIPSCVGEEQKERVIVVVNRRIWSSERDVSVNRRRIAVVVRSFMN